MNRIRAIVLGVLLIVSSALLGAGHAVAADGDQDGLADPTASSGARRDPPPPPVSATILVDRAHLGGMPLQGYLSFLVDNGWQVAENFETLSLDVLLTADILIVPPAAQVYAAAEVQAILDWVAAGGALWVFGDIYGPYPGTASVAEAFGVSYGWSTIHDPVHNEGSGNWPTISDLAPHPVNDGISEYGFYAGVCVAASGPAQPIAHASDTATSADCGSAPPVMAALEAGGRALFCGDRTPFFWTYFPDELDDDEIALLNNMAAWLAGATPIAVENRSWSALRRRYR